MAKWLIVAPYFETATYVWSPYEANWFANELKKRGQDVTVLWAWDAKDSNYEQYLKDADVIDGVGHGNDDVFTGQNYEVLEQAPTDSGKYNGKFFIPVSCLVGKKLLPDMESKNNDFMGLGELIEYTFYFNPYVDHKGEDINEDPVLALFITAEKQFRFSLLDGKTAREAYNDMLQKYMDNAKSVENQDPEIAWTLQLDAQYRKTFGNLDKRLIPQPPQPPPQPPPPQEQYTCPWCGFQADTADKMKEHIIDVHEKDICPPCPPPEKYYTCPYCLKEFNDTESLAKHICSEHFKPCKLSYILRRRLGCPVVTTCSQ